MAKTILESGKTLVDATINTATNPFGTARLLSGAATIERAFEANVEVYQLKAIFPDFQKFSDEKVKGFAEISQGLKDGSISIPSSAFGETQKTEMIASLS